LAALEAGFTFHSGLWSLLLIPACFTIDAFLAAEAAVTLRWSQASWCLLPGCHSGLFCLPRSLDLTGPLLLGGVPNLPEDFPVHNRQFVGCMRNLSIDGRSVDMAGFIANNGTVAGEWLPGYHEGLVPGRVPGVPSFS
jgi:hypothetical protein